ncbi:hypothetical protein [Planobispora takensis]|nr:hypothetical protein [Planobispora takensis]
MIGRPGELRERLFGRALVVRTVAPLADPAQAFSALPAVGGWHPDGTSGYVLEVSEPEAAAPAVTRAPVAAGADVLSISRMRHSLEDVYLELVEQEDPAGPP